MRNKCARIKVSSSALSIYLTVGFIFCLPIPKTAYAKPPAESAVEALRVDPTKHNLFVAVADYSLIRTDFPETTHLSNEQIDQWLIKRAGRISGSQVAYGSNPPPLPIDY